jgi:hypothetical protein
MSVCCDLRPPTTIFWCAACNVFSDGGKFHKLTASNSCSGEQNKLIIRTNTAHVHIIYNVLRGPLSYENNLAFYNSRDFLLPVDTILNKDAGAWLFIKEHSKFNARRLSFSVWPREK